MNFGKALRWFLSCSTSFAIRSWMVKAPPVSLLIHCWVASRRSGGVSGVALGAAGSDAASAGFRAGGGGAGNGTAVEGASATAGTGCAAAVGGEAVVV